MVGIINGFKVSTGFPSRKSESSHRFNSSDLHKVGTNLVSGDLITMIMNKEIL